MGTAEELAAASSLSAETIRERSPAGTLIAVRGFGHDRGQNYPMFQAWAGVAGEPLETRSQ